LRLWPETAGRFFVAVINLEVLVRASSGPMNGLGARRQVIHIGRAAWHDWSRARVGKVDATPGIDDQIIGRDERFAVIALNQHGNVAATGDSGWLLFTAAVCHLRPDGDNRMHHLSSHRFDRFFFRSYVCIPIFILWAAAADIAAYTIWPPRDSLESLALFLVIAVPIVAAYRLYRNRASLR